MRAARAGRSSTPLDHYASGIADIRKLVATAVMRIEKLGESLNETGAVLFVTELDPQDRPVVGTRAKQGDPGGVRPAAAQPLEHGDKNLPDVRVPVIPGFIEKSRYSAHVISLRSSVY